MKLVISPEAERQLNKLNKANSNYLVLWYDTEDCGCGVNGLPALRFTDKKNESYIEVENETFSTLIQRDQAVFFAEKMRLDISNGMFRLSSSEGILNPFISQQSVCYIN
ncbi:iron-sulfur cluster biosynthesis family protein [Virgibacillus sp. C22-A2]|uniref:Iron-sulfur cluster biosynthesis family protein n=1 Tax=Virgibacillus tibetensis TaxID=3042313 RepID=A0ABU6KB56_9BACI|nr:iron-sulfur cluster biosynthesis family protein [Virgibacillus sp. C22-A2]